MSNFMKGFQFPLTNGQKQITLNEYRCKNGAWKSVFGNARNQKIRPAIHYFMSLSRIARKPYARKWHSDAYYVSSRSLWSWYYG